MNLPPLLLFNPNALPPGHTFSLYTLVGALCPAAVNALLIAMSMEVSLALGRRSKCSKCRVLSTMAMFMGTLIEADFATQAAEISFAALWESWGVMWRSGDDEDVSDIVVDFVIFGVVG